MYLSNDNYKKTLNLYVNISTNVGTIITLREYDPSLFFELNTITDISLTCINIDLL